MRKIPDTVVGLYETAGWQPQWCFTTGSSAPAYEQAGLQALARSTSYATARAHAYRVYRILDSVRKQVSAGHVERHLVSGDHPQLRRRSR